ncbi:winged helix-turn-helix domain-containing protein, partial [Tahibacter caeni]|uniref:winged helix-turn-helix domain-containing protein n=1 Tax=Tahibacter caeni TaxID=1453545 RepID=UPI002148F3BE
MPTAVYRFADFRFDPATRELRRGGELVALPPRAFDCLAYLVEHRERAVGRDELIAAVWGKVDVSDTLLAQTILRVRRAVGDTGNEQHAVRTVPRFGYRWVLPTDTAAATAEETPAPEARADPVPEATPTVPVLALPTATRAHAGELRPAPPVAEQTPAAAPRG